MHTEVEENVQKGNYPFVSLHIHFIQRKQNKNSLIPISKEKMQKFYNSLGPNFRFPMHEESDESLLWQDSVLVSFLAVV